MSPKAQARRNEAAAPNLGQRQKTTADVLTGALDVNELDDGYELRYPDTDAWAKKLGAFNDAWRLSCPQMTFELRRDEPAVSVWLEIRGPDGTKQFVEGARYMLLSHINPPPTLSHRIQHGLRFLTSPLRVLPDFLILGAKKCGTTALYSYLTEHPRVAPAFKKEIYFFNAGWRKGAHWYRSFFPTVLERRSRPGGMLTGEATPDYLYQKVCVERVHGMIPNARLIAILRNPVDRAYSFYNHNLRAGLENLTFEEAIDREEERLAAEEGKVNEHGRPVRFSFMHHSYKQRGVYVDQLAEWTRVFPKSQLCVVRTEDLYERPESVLRSVFDLLGLDYHAPKEFRKINTAPYPDMDPAVRAKLEAYFEPHNRRLAEFLGRDLSW